MRATVAAMPTRMNTTSRYLDSLNGIVVAYAVGLVNALLAVLFSFGVNINQDQRTGIVGFVNAALILVAHMAHRQAQRLPTLPPTQNDTEPPKPGP